MSVEPEALFEFEYSTEHSDDCIALLQRNSASKLLFREMSEMQDVTATLVDGGVAIIPEADVAVIGLVCKKRSKPMRRR